MGRDAARGVARGRPGAGVGRHPGPAHCGGAGVGPAGAGRGARLPRRRVVEQMRYAAFRARGLPIGSGVVESANKLVVEARLKGAAAAGLKPTSIRSWPCAARSAPSAGRKPGPSSRGRAAPATSPGGRHRSRRPAASSPPRPVAPPPWHPGPAAAGSSAHRQRPSHRCPPLETLSRYFLVVPKTLTRTRACARSCPTIPATVSSFV